MLLQARFWRKVDKSGNCWLWTGSTNRDGYGQTWAGSNVRRAHRVAWEFEHPPLEPRQQVLHRCDTPACVRIDHLFLGNPSVNMQDMWDKGRHPRPPRGPHPGVQGSRHPNAKLTEADVLAIRARASEKSRVVAADYGVSPGLIRRVRSGRGWMHLNDDMDHLELVVRAEVRPGVKRTELTLEPAG